MKSKLLRQVIEMSKITLYGFAIQCILYGVIVAGDLNAQNPDKSIQEIYISLDVNNVPLRQVLYQIEAKTGFVFAYNLDKNDLNHKVSLNVRKSDLASVLMQISKDSNLKFKRINNNIHIGVRKKFESVQIEEKINQQELTITGQVTSSEDNIGLPGVNVIVQGSTNGTITDVDGNYTISDVPEGATLEFSSVGFIREIVDVGTRTVINISLVPDVTQLSEIVVIGYGEREKKDLTGAISVMDEKDIQKSIAMAPEFAMQGQMAGVLVTSPSGLPTDRPTVRIRGVSSFGNGINDPLYVIDGVPITEFGAGAEQSAAVVRDIRGNVNVMSMINPDDIQSISVLKDASAAAIYGVRAANGVILITTKKGRQGKAKVDFNYRVGIQNFVDTYSVLNTQQYTQLYQESFGANPNFGLPGYFNPDSVNTVNRYDAYLGDKPTFDWQDPFINKSAINTDANVKVYGGTESTNYYVSAGYAYIEAPIKTNTQERYSFATNVSTKVARWIEAGLNYRLSYSQVQDQATTLNASISAPPWQPLLIGDDYYRIGDEVEDKYGYATASEPTYTPNTDHPQFEGDNPDVPPYNVTWAQKYGAEQSGNRLTEIDTRLNEDYYNILRNIGTAYLKLTLYKGLTLKGSVSMDYYHNQRERWGSRDNPYYSPTPGNPYATGDGSSLGNISYRNSWNHNMVSEVTLDWNESFGDHNINVTLNVMDQKYGYRILGNSTEQVTQEDPDKRQIVESEDYTIIGEYRDESALQGYMARASYNYASKYYVDATVRRDGSSKFAPDYRWGTFPSFALAWRMSGENFMSNIRWINDFKWRLGWGQLGNQETKSYAYLSTVNRNPQLAYGSELGDGYGFRTNGLFLPDFPTLDLSWETSTTTNIGFDGMFLDNRLTATVEYYNRLTEDILQQAAFAYSVGNYNNPIINIASVRNNGFEFQVGWRDKIGDIEYYVNGNLTTVHNEVVEVWNDQPLGGSEDRIEEGYPVNYLWGFKVGGIYQSDSEVEERQSQISDNQTEPTLVSAGDMYFLDVHGNPDPENGYDFYSPDPDGEINLNDRTYLGNTIPEYYYGFTLGLNWKGFDVSGFFQGIGGVYKYNWALNSGVEMASQGNNQWINVLNRWTESNKHEWDANDPANALPRAVRGDPAGNNRFSSRFIEKAGYLRLRNLTVGYQVPKTLLGQSGYIERVRLYVSGSNLMTLTKWSGIDPENDEIPIPVTWSFGVNATF
jgi:TonB-linked SusC/RagA family outer membrane protein